ncbi:MAG: flagellar export chaperone FlgN [Planctomycetota bacterium]
MSITPLSLALAGELSAILTGLHEQYTAFHGLLLAQREAIRAADPSRLARIGELQLAALRAISALEDRRRVLVNTISDTGRWTGATPITLSALAQHAPKDQRESLLAMATSLRGVMSACQSEQSTLKSAAQSLAAHIEGVMRQIARTLSHAGTYGRRGLVDTSTAVTTALDLRS